MSNQAWVVMAHDTFKCERCGETYKPNLPCTIQMLVAMSDQFIEEHRECPVNCFGRWKRNVRSLPNEEPLRARHWTAYKALLADLKWEGVLTKEECVRRRQRLRKTTSNHQRGT